MEIQEILTLTISILALLITYAVFKSNQSPRIIIFATPHYGKETFIQLNVKNVGTGIAENITIETDQPIPRRAFGIRKLTHPKEIFEDGIFKYGIKIFHQEQSYIYDWEQFGGLKEALNDQPIIFTVTYTYKPPLNLWKSKISDRSVINIRELEALPSNTGGITEQISKIHKEIKNLNSKIEKKL
jgi:hypothetical protein